ncbi:sorbosone dehydrogenase family protein [Ancylobacter sp. 6x-1]|uniref:Sorbosone dehydrogenase family protein n=1 Tax=Ancylobacter crimeensis TaxID=2579147 RepID=A0ABT0DAG2_9HYPH|nr:sorbosone dehydrogenase family protein [Ancylobacter crimeensis]MCK0196945.1 sorbosone dehydrogenase family protein [Ancylobacter crimeensis]
MPARHHPAFVCRPAFACLAVLGAALLLAGCKNEPPLPESAEYGPDPVLPPARHSWIPTLKVADAVGWQKGALPKAADGFQVAAFATGLDHPRWLYELPNGDILVAETSAPPKPPGRTEGLRGWIQSLFMKKAGAQTPSPNRILLLRDENGDGVAETKTDFLTGLNSPFGMALIGDQLYVANADAVLRFPYKEGATTITEPGVKVADLPAGRNHHWTKSLVASPDGTTLYVGVGSNSNVAENGMAEEQGRAAIWRIDLATGKAGIYASGLRNPVGMDFNPADGRLWVSVNERDEIGNHIVPDYMTAVQDGGFYGWPWSYYGGNVDARVTPPEPAMVARAIKPDYALGAHTASLGFTFVKTPAFGARFEGGAIIGQHGSWNRRPQAGYKVVFVRFENGRPVGMPEPILTGFLNKAGEAQGRPVGVLLDRRGGLLVADDVGNTVWRVLSRQATTARSGPSSGFGSAWSLAATQEGD